jgi:CRP-like cAMP-binding protein
LGFYDKSGDVPTDAASEARHSLKMLPPFAGPDVTEAAIDALCRLAPPVTFERGEVVYREGEPADGGLFVVAGRLSASVQAAAGQRTLGDSVSGDLVGETGLFLREGRRRATLTAVEPSTCLKLGRDLFRDAVGNPAVRALELHFLGLLAGRIGATDEAVVEAWRENAPDGDLEARVWNILGAAR